MNSMYTFMAPIRLSEIHNPNIRAYVHNVKTHVGSQIQAIKTSLYHAHVESNVTKHDRIVLGHYDPESGEYINVGEFDFRELSDWIKV